MQLMPETARQYGVTDAFDPLANLRAGTVHLRKLLDQFEGDLVLALAAYNAGAGAVKRHGGVPNYKETREYVRKVHDKMGGTRTARPRAKRPPAEPVRLVDNGDGTIQLVN
jgi:soluble lytic murein transglycosylase-like protein